MEEHIDYMDSLSPMGCVIAPNLDLAVYSADSQIYQVFLTGNLSILNDTIIDNGGICDGSFSPISIITMDEHTKQIANIPFDAKYMAWAYPLSGIQVVDEITRNKMDVTLPENSFVLFGGFIFFNQNKELIQVNAVFNGDNINFDVPKTLNYGDINNSLIKNGRLQEVTNQCFLDFNIKSFCWITPNENLNGKIICPFGGFLYMYSDKTIYYFEIIAATTDQQYDPFIESKTPFSTIQKCLKYLETEIDENIEGLTDKEIIMKLTGLCQKYKNKVAELQDCFSCKQCMANPQEIAFTCGHMMCHECIKTVESECPMCRAPIDEQIKLYFT
jgi:hypothetical protein